MQLLIRIQKGPIRPKQLQAMTIDLIPVAHLAVAVPSYAASIYSPSIQASGRQRIYASLAMNIGCNLSGHTVSIIHISACTKLKI